MSLSNFFTPLWTKCNTFLQIRPWLEEIYSVEIVSLYFFSGEAHFRPIPAFTIGGLLCLAERLLRGHKTWSNKDGKVHL